MKNLQEEWRPVIGYEGQYEVSNSGRVKSLKRNAQMGLYVTKPRGYLGVVLHNNGVRKAHFVHTLVAASFIGPKPKGNFVNHKDGKKPNNVPLNLEYVTASENARHAWRLGLYTPHTPKGEASHFSKLTEKDVRDILEKTKEGWSLNQLKRHFNVSRVTICRIRTRKTWTHLRP